MVSLQPRVRSTFKLTDLGSFFKALADKLNGKQAFSVIGFIFSFVGGVVLIYLGSIFSNKYLAILGISFIVASFIVFLFLYIWQIIVKTS